MVCITSCADFSEYFLWFLNNFGANAKEKMNHFYQTLCQFSKLFFMAACSVKHQPVLECSSVCVHSKLHEPRSDIICPFYSLSKHVYVCQEVFFITYLAIINCKLPLLKVNFLPWLQNLPSRNQRVTLRIRHSFIMLWHKCFKLVIQSISGRLILSRNMRSVPGKYLALG